jgi:TatD DNase family protein
MASRDMLPILDAHAHIATDVTQAQIQRLGPAVVFAVTRSLSEAASVPHGCYSNVIWGVGCHPGDRAAIERFSPDRFGKLVERFAVVGEVGLDRRAGSLPRQQEVLRQVLVRCADMPILISLHSAGATGEVLDMLTENAVRGPILHWFNAAPGEVARACDLGAWFSVNAAMSDDLVAVMPRDRILTETDFPYTRKHGASRPGASETAEAKLARLWGASIEETRQRIWRNFAAIAVGSGALVRLPQRVADLLEPFC